MADQSVTGFLSGGLLNPNVPDYASLAKKSEAKRQGIIKLGLGQINSVFGGGTSPFYSIANTGENRFDPHQTYYNLSGKGQFQPYWVPGGRHPHGQFTEGPASQILKATPGNPQIFGFATFGKEESPRDIARKQFQRGQLFTAPEYHTFEGFQEPFYQQRAQDYVNFALPQLAQQYQQNRNATIYGLANRGLQKSTIATKAEEDLQKAAGEGRQTIADTGLEQANQLRRDIESARQQAISQLYQSADPAQALQSAISSAAGFQRPSTFTPLANMFSGIAQSYLTNQLLNNYRQPYGIGQPYQVGNYFAPI